MKKYFPIILSFVLFMVGCDAVKKAETIVPTK